MVVQRLLHRNWITLSYRTLCCRLRIPAHHQRFTYATTPKHYVVPQKDVLSGLDNAPILQHVRRRVEERDQLQLEVCSSLLMVEDLPMSGLAFLAGFGGFF